MQCQMPPSILLSEIGRLNGRITLMEVGYGLSSSPFYDLNTLGYVQETRFCI